MSKKKAASEHAQIASVALTEEQIDDVLAKVAAYQTKKTISDAARRTSDEAAHRLETARARWRSLVIAEGVDDPSRLEPALHELVDAMLDAQTKLAAAESAENETAHLDLELINAVNALANPPPPPDDL